MSEVSQTDNRIPTRSVNFTVSFSTRLTLIAYEMNPIPVTE